MRFSTRKMLSVVTVLAVWCAAAHFAHKHGICYEDGDGPIKRWIISFIAGFTPTAFLCMWVRDVKWMLEPDTQGMHGDGI